MITNSQAMVFKYEGTFGLSFNLIKMLTFSTELGYSNFNRAINKEGDRVFTRTSESDNFELVKEAQFNAIDRYRSGIRGKYFMRVHLTYRFGEIK